MSPLMNIHGHTGPTGATVTGPTGATGPSGTGPTGPTGLTGTAPFAAPTIVLGETATAGVATSVIASDATIKAFDSSAPAGMTFGSATVTGSAAYAARRDHVHAFPADTVAAYGTPAVVLGLTATAGSANSAIRTDAGLPIFDTTAPAGMTFGGTVVTGSAAFAARRDHAHAFPAAVAFGTPAVVLGLTATAGVATTMLRTDAGLPIFDTTAPAGMTYGSTTVTGAAAVASRRDHVHAFPAQVTGPTGATVTGPTGGTGPTGVSGGAWLTGTAAPTAGQGVTGDLYLVTGVTGEGDVWTKASGSWA